MTMETSATPYSLVIALGLQGKASGELYVDDGISINPIGSKTYSVFDLRVENSILTVSASKSGYKGEMRLDGVRVFGIRKEVQAVSVNLEPCNFTLVDEVLSVAGLAWQL